MVMKSLKVYTSR